MDPLQIIPPELWKKIFSFVFDPNDLMSCAAANRKLLNVLADDYEKIHFRCVLPIALRWIGAVDLRAARLTCRSWKRDIESCFECLPCLRPSPSTECQDKDVTLRNMLYRNPLNEYISSSSFTFRFTKWRDIGRFLEFSSSEEEQHQQALFCGSVDFEFDCRRIYGEEESQQQRERRNIVVVQVEEEDDGDDEEEELGEVEGGAEGGAGGDEIEDDITCAFFRWMRRFFQKHGHAIRYLRFVMKLNSVTNYEKCGQAFVECLTLAPNLRSLKFAIDVVRIGVGMTSKGLKSELTFNSKISASLDELPELPKIESLISVDYSPPQIDFMLFSKYKERLSRVGFSAAGKNLKQFNSTLRNFKYPKVREIYLTNIRWSNSGSLKQLSLGIRVEKVCIDMFSGTYDNYRLDRTYGVRLKNSIEGLDIQRLVNNLTPERFMLHLRGETGVELNNFNENMSNTCVKAIYISGLYKEVSPSFLQTFKQLAFLSLDATSKVNGMNCILKSARLLRNEGVGIGTVVIHPYYRVGPYFETIPSLKAMAVGPVLFHRDMDGARQDCCDCVLFWRQMF